MPVTNVQQDLGNLTLTSTADCAAPVQRICRSTPTRASRRRYGVRRPTRRWFAWESGLVD
jgi:hypothetical protein